jgi:CelD/BcsL family acetyltransferase involved in cellulose biosynthesis
MSLRTGEDQSELLALREQLEQLESRQRSLRDEMDAHLRRELDAQREELDRELVRRAYRIGELELILQQQGREYESSLSWRVTKPLRVGKALLGELRRR